MFIDNFIKRTCTSIIFIFFLAFWISIGAIYQLKNVAWASYVFILVALILFWLSLWEIINLRKSLKWDLWLKFLIFVFATFIFLLPFKNENYGLYELFAFFPRLSRTFWLFNLIAIFLYLVMLILICLIYNKFQLNDFIFVITWTLYLILMFKAVNFLMLKNYNGVRMGWSSLIYVWIIVIASDVGAYLGGSFLGKHQLAPTVSPKKTWEGVVIGFFTSVTLGLLFIILVITYSNQKPIPFFESDSKILFAYTITTCILSMLSPCGDLLFSYLKRNHGVKNFSNILPGHGGLLDRFDSFSLVIIVTYVICLLCF